MFPVDLVDFGETGVASPFACWYLDWNPTDLEAATLGSMRLYINSAHDNLQQAVAASETNGTGAAITSALRYDVLRQIIEGALASEDFDDQTDYPAGSIGSSMRGAVRIAFGADSVDTVRALRDTARAEFESRIQAAVRLFSR
jgi:hypothetical protein